MLVAHRRICGIVDEKIMLADHCFQASNIGDHSKYMINEHDQYTATQ